MAGIEINAGVINYGGVPLAGAGLLASRPAFGVTGRLYIGTDTNLIYRDTGSAWVSISGSGTITGSGTAGQAAFWTGSSVISGDNTFFWDNTNKRLGLGTATPGVRLDVHGTGVIQQLNGTTTNNAYLDFQNAGITQWRIGNTYNGGNRLFQIIDQVVGFNSFLINNSRQIGLNMPTTTFFNTNSVLEIHSKNIFSTGIDLFSNGGGGLSFNSYFTKNATWGSYTATTTGDQLFSLSYSGSSATSYVGAGYIDVTQQGSTSTFTPSAFNINVNSATIAANVYFRVNGGSGFIETNGRANIAGATDNANFELNVNGNTYTGGLSPTILTVSTNTNMVRTATGYYVTATATLTLPTVSGLNNWYIVIAGTGATVTVQRNGTDTILDKTGASVTSVTVAAGTRSMFYVGGGTITFQIF